MEGRRQNPRVPESQFASFTPADSPLIWEDYLERPELVDLRTTDLKVGSDAPDFTLPLLDLSGDAPGIDGTYHLDEACRSRPQALIFGSFTCPPFRSQVPDAVTLEERFGDRVGFTLVYVHEAHAEDGWVVTGNREADVRESSPVTLRERAELAAKLVDWSKINIRIALDELGDPVCRAYGGMPNRLALVDGDRRIAYLSGEGPMGFHPDELAEAIGRLA